MEKKELRDLTISALVLALAFSIMLSGGLMVFKPFLLPLSLITVSFGFLFHELAHRFTARRFGCSAEYRMWPPGLFLALLFSLFGFVFAAPGAVVIRPRIGWWGYPELTERESGLISLAGPLANIVFALAFSSLYLLYPSETSQIWIFLFRLGARVNSLLALFNLFPFPPLDGSKIFPWSKMVWLVALIVAIVLFLFSL
jgi:Zn-dependent protease